MIFDNPKAQQKYKAVLNFLDLDVSIDGYKLDQFGKKISFNGIKNLPGPGTIIPSTQDRETELLRCRSDILYFKSWYCRILTSKGVALPEQRDYQDKLLTQLQQCYRDLYDFDIIKSRNGWKRLEVTEFFNNIRIITEAKHVNDGLLRIITILAQLFTKKDFLLFDEIENGINPEIIEFLVDLLVASNHQVLITTHSPMILNYIEDDVAMKSIQYIYKTKDGHTKVIPFFNIPQMKKKLEVMGPGEVYVDTDLIKLYDIIKELEK